MKTLGLSCGSITLLVVISALALFVVYRLFHGPLVAAWRHALRAQLRSADGRGGW
jgi:hypothetical protein